MYALDVSIILVNYNTEELLVHAIKSVYENSKGFTFEIIVVDNHSIHSPKDRLNTEFGQQVVYIPMAENVGFGRANNAGIKIARGKYLFLLNTDTYLLNNAIFILKEYMDAHPDVGSSGGNLFTADLKPTYSYHRVPYGIWSYELSVLTFGLSRRLIPYPFYNTSDKSICVGNVSGANMMLRHDVIKKIGAFDPIFFMYCEESELSWRIRKAGFKNVNVPQAHIVHLEGKSSVIKGTRKMMELDGRKKYYIKTRGKFYFEFANRLLLWGLWLRRYAYKVMRKTHQEQECIKMKELVIKAYYSNK